MNNANSFQPFRDEPKTSGIPTKLSPDGIAQRSREARAKANLLPPEEQMSRFLRWLKVTDAGHQPC
jgi:hypothetical protein